jgi:xanthine dehydrogenase molybdopterin-binding subunit B
LGWAAMEELKWGDDNHKWIRPGHLFTCGPGSYKIPSVNDIPLNFKVSLLKVNIFKFIFTFFLQWLFSFWGKESD